MRKLSGIVLQFKYIMRDERLHLAFGCDLINTIVDENVGVVIGFSSRNFGPRL